MTERAREIRDRADEAVGREMQRIQESGELAHLYGKPLELGDDEDSAVAKVLKSQGFSHPTIERSRDLDQPLREAEQILARLQRRRGWLARPGARCTREQAEQFNEQRAEAIGRYREKLEAASRAIRDFNLGAPQALHRRPLRVDEVVAAAERAVPPLEASAGVLDDRTRRGLLDRIRAPRTGT